ncbi:MAG: trehalose-6-phosphate synthase [Chloroflexi bacterium]|nr:trehalose-6-phosphate synthase [Chloroflexota bacterium]
MAKDGRLVVVSNRVPSLSTPATDEEQRALPVGGLVSSLRSALEHRRSIWLGWSGGTSEHTDSAKPEISDIGGVRLASMDLTRYDVDLFYNLFSNRTLWPLLHSFPDKTTIRHDSYQAYRRVNVKFAETLLSFLEKDDLVWVHDYHLIPLGHELRRMGWSGKVGFFLHIPFPAPDIFTVLPWAEELLELLFAYDLVGLQTNRYVRNLSDAISELLGREGGADGLTLGGRSLRVHPYPVGIDPEFFQAMAREARPSGVSRFLRQMAREHRIILGVDRLDYTKGIAQRMLAFERLLERYPSLRGDVTLIQISVPTRSRVPEYMQEREEVDRLVGRINGRFSEADWMPIHPLYRSYSQSELAAFYREADVCLVTPLRDGMNLVAKEFIASQVDSPGVLVLSKFCGAAETMKEALIVNPYDVQGMATAIYTALNMPKKERLRRWEALYQGISSYTAQDWCDSFLRDLAPEPVTAVP